MPDEAAAPEAPDTGTPPDPNAAPPAAPAEGQTESPDNIDWKARYEDLRPEADRRASLIADIEGRNGDDRQRAALAETARIELAEEEEEAEEPDEEEFDLPPDPNERVDQLEQRLAERDEAAKAAEYDQLEQDYTERTVEALEESENMKLSDEGYELIVNYGLSHRDQHDGKPDFEGGFKALKAEREAASAAYSRSKDEAALAPVGSKGEQKVDLSNKEARQKVATEAYEAAERAKENQ